MSHIETFNTEREAINMRDHYNHNLGRRAVVFALPGVPVTDFGGGSYTDIFVTVPRPVWVLVVEG